MPESVIGIHSWLKMDSRRAGMTWPRGTFRPITYFEDYNDMFKPFLGVNDRRSPENFGTLFLPGTFDFTNKAGRIAMVFTPPHRVS